MNFSLSFHWSLILNSLIVSFPALDYFINIQGYKNRALYTKLQVTLFYGCFERLYKYCISFISLGKYVTREELNTSANYCNRFPRDKWCYCNALPQGTVSWKPRDAAWLFFGLPFRKENCAADCSASFFKRAIAGKIISLASLHKAIFRQLSYMSKPCNHNNFALRYFNFYSLNLASFSKKFIQIKLTLCSMDDHDHGSLGGKKNILIENFKRSKYWVTSRLGGSFPNNILLIVLYSTKRDNNLENPCVDLPFVRIGLRRGCMNELLLHILFTLLSFLRAIHDPLQILRSKPQFNFSPITTSTFRRQDKPFIPFNK